MHDMYTVSKIGREDPQSISSKTKRLQKTPLIDRANDSAVFR